MKAAQNKNATRIGAQLVVAADRDAVGSARAELYHLVHIVHSTPAWAT
jgi:hypothetical protein